MGDPQLRANIAALYPGATAENVLVTVGAIQANFTTLLTLTDPGDDVAVMQPNYQQLWGLAQNTGRKLSTFALKGRPRLGPGPRRAGRRGHAVHASSSPW